MSPKWTLCKTSFNIPQSIGKLSKPYSQAASVKSQTGARPGRSEWGQITATNQESLVMTWNSIYIKDVYYWHTATAASSSCITKLCSEFNDFHVLVTNVDKNTIVWVANAALVQRSTWGTNHKINEMYKMGWTHQCSSISKRWVELSGKKKSPTSKRSQLIILANYEENKCNDFICEQKRRWEIYGS